MTRTAIVIILISGVGAGTVAANSLVELYAWTLLLVFSIFT